MQVIRPSVRTVRGSLVCAFLVLSSPGCARRAETQTLSPYTDFQALAMADMDSVRVKLTYGGAQDQPVMSLGFATAGAEIPLSAFAAFRRSGFEYSNEDVGVLKVTLQREQLKAIIDEVGGLPRVTDGGVDPGGSLSFALLTTAGGPTKVFESIVNDTTGRQLFPKIMEALATNQGGTRKLLSLGCTISMMPTDAPASAEGQVTVRISGLRQDRRSLGQFVSTVKVTNQSGTTLAAPLTLVVIRKSGNAVLLQEDGFTCNIEPGGTSFINLPVRGGLAPGASVEKLLRFSNPSLMKFDLDFRVFAGPGTR
jgi:hypothetical protein